MAVSKPIPKLEIPTLPSEVPRTHERAVPVSARTRIATAGKVSALTKVYEPVQSDSEDSEDDHMENSQPQQPRVPPLPLLLDGKCGLPAKPTAPVRLTVCPTLNSVREDSMLSSDLLSSSEDEEELLVECNEVEAMISHRSALIPLSFRSALHSEATISVDLSVMSRGSRCASASGLGAMAGGAGGAFVGLLSGIIPAPLTFGLSVPINAGIGSIGGMIMGTAGGSICQSMKLVEIEAISGTSNTQRGLTTLDTQRTAASSARSAPAGVLVKFGEDETQDAQMDAMISSALKGGLAMGSLGGASGSAVGGLVGAAVGLPPAILTFGLSVPVCATLGSGLGLCIGSVAGGSMGLVGGSLLGSFSRGTVKHDSSDLQISFQ